MLIFVYVSFTNKNTEKFNTLSKGKLKPAVLIHVEENKSILEIKYIVSLLVTMNLMV